MPALSSSICPAFVGESELRATSDRDMRHFGGSAVDAARAAMTPENRGVRASTRLTSDELASNNLSDMYLALQAENRPKGLS